MTNKFGTHYGIFVPQDFGKVLVDIAERENKMPHDLFLELAQEGAECRRLHRRDDAGRSQRRTDGRKSVHGRRTVLSGSCNGQTGPRED